MYRSRSQWRMGQSGGGIHSLLVRFAATGIAVFLAISIVPGIEAHSLAAGFATVIVLSFLNAVIRPVLYLFSLPLIILSLGFFMVLINALLLQFAAYLVKGFIVHGFWPSVGGALVISLVSGMLTMLFAGQSRVETIVSPPRPPRVVNPDDPASWRQVEQSHRQTDA